MIVSLVILGAMAVLLIGLLRSGIRKGGSDVSAETWSAAASSKPNSLDKLLLSVAKPVSRAVEINPQSNVYRVLNTKLAATGGSLYGASVEVFLSVQIAAILIAAAGLAILPMLGMTGMPLAAVALGMLVVAVFPINQVHEAGKKRLKAVRAELPEFAEMLLMPVSSGFGILPALDFTANRLDGVVAQEVRTMLQLMSSRVASEAAVFESTGLRLGDPAAVTFFNTLYQAYSDGVKVVDSIRTQAEQLRHAEHQRKRAILKKLPNKMVFIIALHLLPFLFVITVLPTLFAMKEMS